MRPAPLLQSWAWGEVQARSGWRVERLHLRSGQASVQVRGHGGLAWAYVPRGPVPPAGKLLDELAEWARDRRLARLRLDPETGRELAAALEHRGFRRVAQVQPPHTQIVTLADDDSLLASFKPKWRYNVRLADRRGVEVSAGDEVEELARQAGATAAREGISLPSAAYYRLLQQTLDWCRIYVAKVAGEPVAAILVAAYDGRAYYLFGGSNGRHRDAMPNHALHWRAMRDARDSGCTDYDLWGVPAPDAAAGDAWAGIGRFKEGFGGRRVEYVGTWELVLRPLGNRVGTLIDKGREQARRIKRLVNNR
jgi:lipid II:glycine glycyltransferase (peptidoglycan interpeptide bridge formation enzyme)